MQLSTCGVEDFLKLCAENYQALRAWCGVTSVGGDPILYLFGDPGEREAEIRMAENLLQIDFSPAQRHVLNTLDGALNVIACVAGAGKTKVLQAILLWVYHQIVVMCRDDIGITYCASTQELVKQTLDEFRDALPQSDRLSVAWGFGFDRVRFVDRFYKQIHNAVALKTPVVAIADTLTELITFVEPVSNSARLVIESNCS